MKFFGIEKKALESTNAIREVERAGSLPNEVAAALMAETIAESLSGASREIQPKQAYDLAESSSDLGGIVNKIATSIATMKKGLRNDKDSSINYDVDILRFLASASEGFTAMQWWRESAEAFLLTESAFIILRGNINKAPLAKTFVRPFEVTVQINQSDGLPDSFRTESKRDRRTYKREEKDGVFRYVSDDGLNELCPIRGAVSIIDGWSGRSPLNKLKYDVETGTQGKIHNHKLITRGFRKDGIVSPDPSGDADKRGWDKDKVEKVKNIFKKNVGASNAGGILVSGQSMRFEGFSQSNRDMDFVSLLKMSKESVADLYNYPLALFSTQSMTYDNYTTANRVYYSKCAIPNFDRFADGLLAAIGKRFGIDVAEFSLVIDPASISDLRPSLYEDMSKLRATQATTTDEIRAIGGFESAEDGGDEILVGAGMSPLSTVALGKIDTTPTPDMQAQMRSSAPVSEPVKASAPVGKPSRARLTE